MTRSVPALGLGFGLALLACGGSAANAAAGKAGTSQRAIAPNEPASSSNTTSRPSQRLSLSASGGCWLRDGRVWCWNGAPSTLASEGRSARAGAVAPTSRPVALPAPALDAAGTLRFGCAVLASGAVHCWGDNTWGQLGAGSRALAAESPLATLGIHDATQIAVASDHACAILKDGSVACWGNNSFGQCGHDREYAPAVRQLVQPERVDGVRDARRVVVSASSSCALGDSDTWCWGELLRVNDGSGPATDRTRATRILPLARARALALGDDCGCAISAQGAAACFALTARGCPSPDVRAGLEPLFGWSDVRALAVGARGACAERTTGGTSCWLHPAREPALDAPARPALRPLLASGGIPAIADGPCRLDASQLDCWDGSFWDEPAATPPRRIRLP